MAHPYPFAPRYMFALSAAVYLAGARARLHRTSPEDVIALNTAARASSASGRHAGQATDPADLTARVAFFIPRMALRVPWRADCLVQALAGQSWLTANGVVSEIAIGTAKAPDGEFKAHAWLICDGHILLGGDVAQYSPLLRPQPEA